MKTSPLVQPQIWLLALFMFLAPAVGAKDHPQYVERHEEQVFATNCKATRNWVEFLPGGNAAQTKLFKINAWIERKLTVGKKLTATDCPERESNENYEYINHATVSGIDSQIVGIRLAVYFPGGTGRYSVSCEVARFDTGRVFQLSRYLTPSGKRRIAQTLSTRIANVTEGTFCLTKDGIELSVFEMGSQKSPTKQLLIPPEKVRRYFNLPAALRSIAAATP